MEIVKKFISLLQMLIIFPLSVNIINRNYVHCECNVEWNKSTSWFERIKSVNLSTGIGKTISNAVNENIRINAELLGEYGKNYWAWKAINKEYIDAKDPVALKYASSIELLKKLIVSVFYRSNKFIHLDGFLSGTFSHISDIINNCYYNKINWYGMDEIRQKIFGLINGVFVLLLLDENIHCINDNCVSEYDSIHKMLEDKHPIYKNGIWKTICSYMEDYKLTSNSNITLYEEILSKFNNNESEIKEYFAHDARCYLEQFNVLTFHDLPKGGNNKINCSSVIGKYIYTCYWKEQWIFNTGIQQISHSNDQVSLLHKSVSSSDAFTVLSNWLNDKRQHEVYKICDEALDIWVKQKLPNFEDLVKQYNDCIECNWYSDFKSSVKIDYGDIAFLTFIENLMSYDDAMDNGCKLLCESACRLTSNLLLGLYDWESKPGLIILPPLLGCDNVRHLKPIDILMLTTRSYSYLQRYVMCKMAQIKRYSSLQNNILQKCNLIITDIFEYIVFKGLTNVNVDSVIKLIKFLIDEKIDDIIYDLDERCFGPHARKWKIYSWIPTLKSLIANRTDSKEKDFSKIVNTIIKYK